MWTASWNVFGSSETGIPLICLSMFSVVVLNFLLSDGGPHRCDRARYFSILPAVSQKSRIVEDPFSPTSTTRVGRRNSTLVMHL